MDLDDSRFAGMRQRMIDEQLVQRGIRDERVLEAVRSVPRHLFVPLEYWDHAYADMPLPIGSGQTISQPYIVAFMTAVLGVRAEDKVLEVGTGSGYQAAVLGRLARQVITVECVPALARRAAHSLKQLDLHNVSVRTGDGSRGWPQEAPYDCILVPAAAPGVPRPLLAQLAEHGRMVLPVGTRRNQTLQLWTRQRSRNSRRILTPVRFVPLVGMWGWRSSEDLEEMQ